MTSLAPQPGPLPPWGVLASAAWVVLAFVVSSFATALVYGAGLGRQVREAASSYDGVLLAVWAIASIPIMVAVLGKRRSGIEPHQRRHLTGLLRTDAMQALAPYARGRTRLPGQRCGMDHYPLPHVAVDGAGHEKDSIASIRSS